MLDIETIGKVARLMTQTGYQRQNGYQGQTGYNKRRRSAVTWYVYVDSSDMNRAIADELPGHQAQMNLLCADGERRHLWQCDSYKQVALFKRLAENISRRIRVFRRRGEGKIGLFPFLK